jgi:hypothetical protein
VSQFEFVRAKVTAAHAAAADMKAITATHDQNRIGLVVRSPGRKNPQARPSRTDAKAPQPNKAEALKKIISPRIFAAIA